MANPKQGNNKSIKRPPIHRKNSTMLKLVKECVLQGLTNLGGLIHHPKTNNNSLRTRHKPPGNQIILTTPHIRTKDLENSISREKHTAKTYQKQKENPIKFKIINKQSLSTKNFNRTFGKVKTRPNLNLRGFQNLKNAMEINLNQNPSKPENRKKINKNFN